jgi:hypothetical protein
MAYGVRPKRVQQCRIFTNGIDRQRKLANVS